MGCMITIYSVSPCDCDMFDGLTNLVEDAVTCGKENISALVNLVGYWGNLYMAKGHKDSVKYKIGYSQAEKGQGPQKLLYISSQKKVALRPLKKLNICLWIVDLEWQMFVVDLRANFGQTLPNQAQKKINIASITVGVFERETLILANFCC